MGAPAGQVFGREAELSAVNAMLAAARQGLSGLVLEGEPGIGKTTVWRTGLAQAAVAGFHVLSCRAAPSETRLSFAALTDLLAPVDAAAFDSLLGPQRRALAAALLRSDAKSAAPDPRAIGTGLVSLVAQLTDTTPVLIAIDDLQWLDSPSARAIDFMTRRVELRPVAVLATVRLGERSRESGVPSLGAGARIEHLRLGPLSLAALYRILDAQLGRRLSRPILVRIHRVCGGNPFYALEVVRALRTGERAAGDGELPIPDDLRQLVAARIRRFPRRTREALLKVSALARPTLRHVDPTDLGPAEEAGVIRVVSDGRIEFAHPLLAVAVYSGASHQRRRIVHAELAAVVGDVEERARHLMVAHASDGGDGPLAAVLHEAAEHARRRGAVEIAADLEEHAARRLPDDHTDLRRQRLLRAARHNLTAGDPRRADLLCEEVLAAALPSEVRAQALALLAEARAYDRPQAAVDLLEEALTCVGDDAGQAAQLEIALGGVLGAVLEVQRSHRHLARAVELADEAGDPALLAQASALKECYGLFAGKGVDENALARALALDDPDREVPFQLRVTLNVAQTYQFTGRLDQSRALFLGLRDRLRARGAETDLAWALGLLAETMCLAGDLDAAEQEASEAERVATLTGVELFRAFALMVRAQIRATRGHRDGARADATEAMAVSERIGWPFGVAHGRWALALLALSEADPTTAASVLDTVVAGVEAFGVYEWPLAMVVPEAIEAFAATGSVERARRLTEALAHWGRTFDRPWALATSARCQALLAAAAGDLDRAAAAAAQSLVHHHRLPMPFELGRTLLVMGQIQRRRGERGAGRATLQRALLIFQQVGAARWAERATAEITRLGVRRAPAALTEGEYRVAELAAHGLTNPEIAARLFMSRRTVEANLARAYRKLEIRSRAELGAIMATRKPGDPS